MNQRFFYLFALTLFFFACKHHHHDHDTHGAHDDHEDLFQHWVYTDDMELFVETEPLIAGEKAQIYAHLTMIPGFKPMESGTITLLFEPGSASIRQVIQKPAEPGIYAFEMTPENPGKGSLRFVVENSGKKQEILIPDITVFSNKDEADAAFKSIEIPQTNATAFTKNKSWKTDFSTGYPIAGPFGQIIKTTALVQSPQHEEVIVSARTNGVVNLSISQLFEGRELAAGQTVCTVTSDNFADNNISVKFAEAKNIMEKTRAEYMRVQELVKDKLVSERQLQDSRMAYENARVVYENLSKNFSAKGQTVKSPVKGFVRQIFAKNGSYVEAGDPLFSVSQNKNILLKAEVRQKYLPVLGTIRSANIKSTWDDKIYTLEELNGKILSYGKTLNPDNYMVPVIIQVDNRMGISPGSFVEVYLKANISDKALTVPKTALIEEQGVFFVWVQRTPELFEKRDVKVGKTDGLRTEILQGLSAEERIVLKGAMLVKLAEAAGALDAHAGHVH